MTFERLKSLAKSANLKFRLEEKSDLMNLSNKHADMQFKHAIFATIYKKSFKIFHVTVNAKIIVHFYCNTLQTHY